jgi:hypothetical protein
MAVKLEYYNLIIPIDTIDRFYPGGFKKYIKDYKKEGRLRPFWHDDHLFHDGSMGSYDLEQSVEAWEKLGLVGIAKENGREYWKDFCVLDFMNAPEPDCDWLEFVRDEKLGSYAYMKGKPVGEIVSTPIVPKLEGFWKRFMSLGSS